MIQKRAIRTITKSFFSSHTEPRMKKIGLLKFEDLYRQQCLMLTHDCIRNRAPTNVSQLVQKEQDVSRFNLRNHVQNPLNLKIPCVKSKAASTSFSAKGPVLWNELHNELKQTDKRSVFKNALKRQMLAKYQLKTECNNPRCNDRKHHGH